MFKPILKSEDPNNRVFSYSPKPFALPVPGQALSFARSQEDGSTSHEFVIDKLIAETTRLTEVEKDNFRAKIETQVLERLHVVEEKAYKEAYALGLKEGQEKGFQETKAAQVNQLEQLAKICEDLTKIKESLLVNNEAHLMKTVFHTAKAMALDTIRANPENIKKIVAAALESAQSEEEIVLRLNPADANFIESSKTEAGSPLARATRLRIEANDLVALGGCVVETNYGIVDASIEQRVKKVWEALNGKIPKALGPVAETISSQEDK